MFVSGLVVGLLVGAGFMVLLGCGFAVCGLVSVLLGVFGCVLVDMDLRVGSI